MGIFVMVGECAGRGMIGLLARLIAALALSWFVSQKLVTFLARPNKEDLSIMRDLMATGKVTPVIDKGYSLSEVPEACLLYTSDMPMERLIGCNLKWKTIEDKEVIMLLGRDLLQWFLMVWNGKSSDVFLAW